MTTACRAGPCWRSDTFVLCWVTMNDHPLVGIWPLKQAGPGRVINPYTKRAIKVGGATHTSVVQQLSVSANNPLVAAAPPKEKKLRKKPQLTERARPKKVKLAERMQAAEKSRARVLKGRAPRPPKLSPVATTGGVSAIDARLMRAEENRQGAAAEKAARLEQAATRRAQAQAYRAEVAEMQHLSPPVLPPPLQAALWGTSPAAGRPSFNTRNLAAEDRRKAALERKRTKARAEAPLASPPAPARPTRISNSRRQLERESWQRRRPGPGWTRLLPGGLGHRRTRQGCSQHLSPPVLPPLPQAALWGTSPVGYRASTPGEQGARLPEQKKGKARARVKSHLSQTRRVCAWQMLRRGGQAIEAANIHRLQDKATKRKDGVEKQRAAERAREEEAEEITRMMTNLGPLDPPRTIHKIRRGTQKQKVTRVVPQARPVNKTNKRKTLESQLVQQGSAKRRYTSSERQTALESRRLPGRLVKTTHPEALRDLVGQAEAGVRAALR